VVTLDRSRPYGEIHGYLPEYPRAWYFQGGAFFDASGALVHYTPEQAPVGADYDTWHWKQLRRAVLDRGGEWINKVAAVAWLKEHDKVRA
jgi:hypothetical protein